MNSSTCLCFSYGSNLATRRITAATRAPSAEKVAVGWLDGYRLTFDKVSTDGSGKCDCEHTGKSADRVYGVIFRIDVREQPALDKAEGLGNGYEKQNLRVMTDTGPVNAVAYIATKKDPARRPYDWYKEHVLRGAREHGLPKAYVRAIESVETVGDPNGSRTARERSIWLE